MYSSTLSEQWNQCKSSFDNWSSRSKQQFSEGVFLSNDDENSRMDKLIKKCREICYQVDQNIITLCEEQEEQEQLKYSSHEGEEKAQLLDDVKNVEEKVKEICVYLEVNKDDANEYVKIEDLFNELRILVKKETREKDQQLNVPVQEDVNSWKGFLLNNKLKEKGNAKMFGYNSETK